VEFGRDFHSVVSMNMKKKKKKKKKKKSMT
jgi:hypothetical protein